MAKMTNQEFNNKCCNCKYLISCIESVSKDEGTIKHFCKIDDKEVEWASCCINGKFEKKNK